MDSRSHRSTAAALLVGMSFVLGLNAYWFLAGNPLDRAEPVRLVAGALFIFLLPGLVGGELLRLRGRSPLETLAIAAAGSLAVEIGLIALVFLVAASIAVWVAL